MECMHEPCSSCAQADRDHTKFVNQRLEAWNTAYDTLSPKTWKGDAYVEPHDVMLLARFLVGDGD